jgi:enoyl-CoA hydratase/carnithine racemase
MDGMQEDTTVLSDINETEGFAFVKLNRPRKKNALSIALLDDLSRSLAAIRINENIRCVVLCAEGDSFSAGRDLGDMREDARKRARWADERGSVIGIVKALREMPQITIAAVQGYCLGGGMVLMNGCDLAFAADDAKIGMPEILRGSYGRSATPTLFQSRIPIKQAFFIQVTGRNLSGAEAARMGLVSQSVPAAELMDHVGQLAREIATRNPVALEHAKIAAYSALDLPFDLAVKADEAISHRMRFYTDPLADVEGYLKSQKGGTNTAYRGPKG